MNEAWYGNVPNEWNSVSLRYLTESTTGGTPDRSNTEFWEGDIPWVSPKDMKSSRIGDAEEYVTQDAVNRSSTVVVPENSLVVVARSGILEHTIPVAVTTSPVAINQDIRAYIPRTDTVDPQFLQLFITSHQTALLNLWRKQGATVQSLDSDEMGATEFPIPPTHIQRRIVRYCEQEVERIDELVASQRDLLDLLEEKRQALITAAVTGHIDVMKGGGRSGQRRVTG